VLSHDEDAAEELAAVLNLGRQDRLAQTIWVLTYSIESQKTQ